MGDTLVLGGTRRQLKKYKVMDCSDMLVEIESKERTNEKKKKGQENDKIYSTYLLLFYINADKAKRKMTKVLLARPS